MHKKAIIAGTAIALAIGAGIVRAQSGDSAWYGGIDLGRSRLGLGGGDFDNALANQGIGILPLRQSWSVYGKAGVARTTTDLEASSDTGAVAVGNASASRTGLLIGAGAMYDFNRNVFARAGWDRYAQIGSDDTGKGHADVYSIGVGYRF